MRQRPVSHVRGYLLLCSHMRGYTTLLGHILGSHSQITGYAEMHRRLRDRVDLQQLAVAVSRQGRKSYHQRYVFDNLLHNHLPISGRVLRRGDVHPLVMVREPRATIESILRLKARYIEEVSVAEQYYIERLTRLQQIVLQSRGTACFLQAEALIEQSERVLSFLGHWLQLEEPLQPDYQRFQHTGKRRLGDSSAAIHSGRILSVEERASSQNREPSRQIGSAEVDRAEQAYRDFMQFVSVQVAADKAVFA